jgi:hypothetical protein
MIQWLAGETKGLQGANCRRSEGPRMARSARQMTMGALGRSSADFLVPACAPILMRDAWLHPDPALTAPNGSPSDE